MGKADSGGGLDAVDGGHVEADACTLSTAYDGVLVSSGGSVEAENAHISSCDFGCRTLYNGSADISESTISNSSQHDIYAEGNGSVYAYGVNTKNVATYYGGQIVFD